MKPLPLLVTSLITGLSVFAQGAEVYWSGMGDGVGYEDFDNWDPFLPNNSDALIFGEAGYTQSALITMSGLKLGGSLEVRNGSFSLSGPTQTDGLNLGAGSFLMNSSGSLTLGSAATGGTFSGGSMTLASGTTHLYGGLKLSSATGSLVIGSQFGQSAIFNHHAGSLALSAGSTLYLAGAGQGTYNFNSGATLRVGGSQLQGAQSGGTYNFNLNGGKIVVTGSNLDTSVNSTITGGRTVIDTNGLNAKWGGNITTSPTATGGREFAKEGAGHLEFSGASREMRAFATLGGTTTQTAGETVSQAFLVGYGAGNTASYDLEEGSIDIYSVTVGSTTTGGTLRIGDYGGTGVFNQRGGTVSIADHGSLNVGNLGSTTTDGNGTYNLMDGTLTLNGGLHNVGRSNQNGVSSGALNLSGGTLVVQNGGQLIIGNRDAGYFNGVGTFTQTNGTADFTNGFLYIGSYGQGTYNLRGGELLIGGNRLAARYGNSSGIYAFNLGGGTLKVTGSHLTSSVSATLEDASTSTIDTNSYNATFSSTISGSGDLIKKGTGELSVTTLTASKVDVQAGSLRSTTLTADHVDLASGTELRTGSHSVTRFTATNASLGSTTSAPFRIASGSRLEGTATLLSATEVSGVVRVGSATEAGEIIAEQELLALDGSRFELGLFANSNTTGTFSQIIGESGFAFDGAISLHLLMGDEVDFSDAFWQEYGQTWLLFAGGVDLSEVEGIFTVTSNVDYSDYGRFEVIVDEVDGVSLRWQAIPEPSTYALLVLTGMGALFARKRRS